MKTQATALLAVNLNSFTIKNLIAGYFIQKINLVVVSHYDCKKCIERPAPVFITQNKRDA